MLGFSLSRLRGRFNRRGAEAAEAAEPRSGEFSGGACPARDVGGACPAHAEPAAEAQAVASPPLRFGVRGTLHGRTLLMGPWSIRQVAGRVLLDYRGGRATVEIVPISGDDAQFAVRTDGEIWPCLTDAEQDNGPPIIRLGQGDYAQDWPG